MEIDGKKTPVRSSTEIMDDERIISSFDFVSEEVVKNKGRIGTVVHRLIEEVLLGKGRTKETRVFWEHHRVLAYFNCWKRWYADQNNLEVFRTESSHILSDPRYMFAGTYDLLAWEPPDWVVYDWKCRRPYPYDALQLASYSYLAAADPTTACTALDLQAGHIKRRAVYLNDKGYRARVIEYDDYKDINDWLALVRVWHLRDKYTS